MSSRFGLYVHVPFCSKRCDYCAFATWTDAEQSYRRYFQSVLKEYRHRKDMSDLAAATSLYFGGGTPSLVPPEYLGMLIDNLEVEEDAEITVECNPESTTLKKLAAYKSFGVNRISFGLQSMSSDTLRTLGRDHDSGQIFKAIDSLGEAGFEDYSVDLIYGASGESLKTLEDSINTVMNFPLPPTHISAYALTVEQGTPLSKDLTRYPDEDIQADAYDLIDQMLESFGFKWYEISNWAKQGRHSRHNWNYWMQGEYLGLGCSAHSHLKFNRTWNIFNYQRYMDAVSTSTLAIAGSQQTMPADRILEGLELLVRTRLGVPADSFTSTVDIGHLLGSEQDTLRLTREGRRLANQVSIRLDPSLIDSSRITSLQSRDPWSNI